MHLNPKSYPAVLLSFDGSRWREGEAAVLAFPTGCSGMSALSVFRLGSCDDPIPGMLVERGRSHVGRLVGEG